MSPLAESRRARGKKESQMENQNDIVESNVNEQADDEQLTVDVPVEVRAGGAYNCCKRLAE
jgi:hypothetical protein